MKTVGLVVQFLLLVLLGAGVSQAKKPDHSLLLVAVEQAGSAIDARTGVRVSDASFELDGKNVECLRFAPAGDGPWPGLLLIPGYETSARDWTTNGLFFASAGYECLAVSQPGFGKSDGPADFVGPLTIAALSAAWARLLSDPQVNPDLLGIVGYSRGAMAAAILATRLENVRSAVLGAGIYDFQSAYDTIESKMIKSNMADEAGMSAQAIRDRSPILDMGKLNAAVLILHGAEDKNAPVSQAYLLRDNLEELGKDFEIVVLNGREHSIGLENFQQLSLDFLRRTLAAK